MAQRSQRKRRKAPPPSREPAAPASSGSWRSLDPGLRASWLYGLLVSIFGVGLFIFPVKVDPIEALGLCLGMLTMGAILHGYGFRSDPADFFRKLASLPALALFGLALWGFLRWKLARFPAGVGSDAMVPIPSAGRDGVIALLLFALGFAFALGLSFQKELRLVAVWRAFRAVLVVAAFGFSLLGIYQFFFGYELMLERLREAQAGSAAMDPLMLQSLEYALQERRVGGTLGNGNVFAAWLSVLGVACLSWVGREHDRGARICGGAGFLLVTLTLLLTGSRGGMLTLAMATMGALLVLWRTGGLGSASGGEARARLTGSMASLPLLLGGATLLIAKSAWAIDVTYRLTRITTIRERLNYWTVAVKIWATDLLVGGGPGAFELFYPRLKAMTARESRFAHSWIFQTGSELGLIGLVLLLLFWLALGILAFKAWRGARRSAGGDGIQGDDASGRSHEALWLALTCVVLAFNGLFEYTLSTAEFVVLLGLCSGGLAGLVPSDEKSGSISTAVKARAGVSALMFTGVILAGLALIPRAQLAANWEWKGEGAALSGEPFLAAGYYARAARLLPGDEGPVFRRSGALMRISGREAEAEALLERAAELNPLSARIRAAQARSFESRDDFEQALVKMDEALGLYPADAGYRLQRAKLLHRMGRDEAARAELGYVEENAIPIWRYLRPEFDDLRVELGLEPTAETLREREREAKRQARKAQASP